MSEISYINISTTPTFISTCLKSLTSIYLQLLPLYLHVRNILHQYIYNSYLYIYMSEISYINISTTPNVRNLLHQYIYNSYFYISCLKSLTSIYLYFYIYMSEISYINISTTPTFISTCLKSLTSIYLQLLPLYLHV